MSDPAGATGPTRGDGNRPENNRPRAIVGTMEISGATAPSSARGATVERNPQTAIGPQTEWGQLTARGPQTETVLAHVRTVGIPPDKQPGPAPAPPGAGTAVETLGVMPTAPAPGTGTTTTIPTTTTPTITAGTPVPTGVRPPGTTNTEHLSTAAGTWWSSKRPSSWALPIRAISPRPTRTGSQPGRRREALPRAASPRDLQHHWRPKSHRHRC